jgi:hypothetical protein
MKMNHCKLHCHQSSGRNLGTCTFIFIFSVLSIRAPTIKRETFVPATSFDFNEAKDKPALVSPFSEIVNFLDFSLDHLL